MFRVCQHQLQCTWQSQCNKLIIPLDDTTVSLASVCMSRDCSPTVYFLSKEVGLHPFFTPNRARTGGLSRVRRTL